MARATADARTQGCRPLDSRAAGSYTRRRRAPFSSNSLATRNADEISISHACAGTTTAFASKDAPTIQAQVGGGTRLSSLASAPCAVVAASALLAQHRDGLGARARGLARVAAAAPAAPPRQRARDHAVGRNASASRSRDGVFTTWSAPNQRPRRMPVCRVVTPNGAGTRQLPRAGTRRAWQTLGWSAPSARADPGSEAGSAAPRGPRLRRVDQARGHDLRLQQRSHSGSHPAPIADRFDSAVMRKTTRVIARGAVHRPDGLAGTRAGLRRAKRQDGLSTSTGAARNARLALQLTSSTA